MKEDDLDKYSKEIYDVIIDILQKMVKENSTNTLDLIAVISGSFLISLKNIYENIKEENEMTWNEFLKNTIMLIT